MIDFLREVGFDDVRNAEAIAAFSPLVLAAGEPALPRWHYAVQFARRRLPAYPSAREFDQENAVRWRRARRRAEAMRRPPLGPEELTKVEHFIIATWCDTGLGPTWREVGRHLGWTGRETVKAIEALLERGNLTSTSARRSLRVAPRAHREAAHAHTSGLTAACDADHSHG